MKNITFVLMMLVEFVANSADPAPVPVDGVFSNPVHSCNLCEPTFDFNVNIENNNFLFIRTQDRYVFDVI